MGFKNLHHWKIVLPEVVTHTYSTGQNMSFEHYALKMLLQLTFSYTAYNIAENHIFFSQMCDVERD